MSRWKSWIRQGHFSPKGILLAEHVHLGLRNVGDEGEIMSSTQFPPNFILNISQTCLFGTKRPREEVFHFDSEEVCMVLKF